MSGIIVSNCTLKSTDNGLRIKTWAPSQSSIVVSDISYSDITLDDVDNPIIIDQHYCPHGECKQNVIICVPFRVQLNLICVVINLIN